LRRIAAVSAAGVAASLALAACGDDSGGGGGSASGGGGDCSAPGVTDDTITVATVSPLTGPSASTFAGFVEGAEARFAAANAEGGVGGREIEVVTNDDIGDGAQQSTAARNAVQSQQAFAILSASRVDTMFDYLATQSVPVVGYPGQPAYAEDDNVFGFAGGSQTGYFAEATVDRMQEAGATNIAVLAHNSPGSLNSANGMIQAAEAAGLEVGVTSFDVPLGSFDATGLAIQMKDAGVDGIYAPTLTDSTVSVLRAADEQGVDLPANYVSQVYDPAIADQVDEYIEGAFTAPVATVPVEVTDNEGVQAYLAAMEEYAPDTGPASGFTQAGYLSADLFLSGVEAAGDCLSRESLIESLRGLEGYDGGGFLTEPAVFSGGPFPNGSGPYGGCTWFVTREGGAWVPDAEATCGELLEIEQG
jgi:ABC-type branched-subunit amino acid transport system substrate-binding protein